MRNFSLYFTFISLCICFFVPKAYAGDTNFSGTMELIVPKKPEDLHDPIQEAEKKRAKLWYPTGEPISGKGELWEQGQSAEQLNRRRVPQKDGESTSIDTRANIEKQLKNISEYERGQDTKPVTFADGKIHGDSSVDKSTWRPTITEPVKIDEPILESQRNVVGAYADIVDDDDFHMSAGPEVHIQSESESPLGQSTPPATGTELGLGMKFLWGF